MKKILLMPDSFKGSLSAQRFCEITQDVLKESFPECIIKSFPVADGGEGTTDCFLKTEGYSRVDMTATDGFGNPKNVYYAKNGKTAVIEMAMCASLPDAKGRENPSVTTTFGVGEMIKHAVLNGADNIIVGLGGSSTNDAGAGMSSALGVKFYNKNGETFIPVGDTLCDIWNFDKTDADNLLKGIKITGMCDIDNPLYGKNGAAYVFAPQKGADADMVKTLDDNLRRIAALTEKKTGTAYHEYKGAGSAGGMGFGVCAFLGGELKPGVGLVLDTIGFDSEITDTDLIITGEGRLDSQSLSGKAVIGISRRAKIKNVPVIAVTGSYTGDCDAVYCEGVTAVFSTNPSPQTLTEATQNIEQNLRITVKNISQLIKSFE